MKHLLNNMSEQEKNAIREQHTGGMQLSNQKFRKLVKSKLGDVKTIVKESRTISEQRESKDSADINQIMDLGYRFMMDRNPDGPKNKMGFEAALDDLKWIFKTTISNIEGQRRGIGGIEETKEETKEGFFDDIFGKPDVDRATRDSMRATGASGRGRRDSDYGRAPKREDEYVIFKGRQFSPDDIEYASYDDLGDLPRIEDGKLIVTNPAWEL